MQTETKTMKELMQEKWNKRPINNQWPLQC